MADKDEADQQAPEYIESEPQTPAPDFMLVETPAEGPAAEENAEEAAELAPELAQGEPQREGTPTSEAAPASSEEPIGLLRRRKRPAEDKTESVPQMPYLGVETAAEPTVLSRVFNSLSLGAIFVLVAVFLLQVLPGLQAGRLLWFSDELRQADILAGAFNGHWLQLQLNGQLYQEAPPLYFWFLMGLHKLLSLAGFDLGADYARLLYAGAAVSGLLLLLATYGLARSTARLDRRGAFAAGCVLLSVLFLQFFFHYSSLDLFFAAFIITSHIFMFKALLRTSSPLYMGLAFLCAAVALMSKGALGLVLPVLSAVLFCLWRGKPQRLLKGDFLLGVVLALLPAIIWLGSIWAAGQHDVVVRILREQIWIKAFGDAWHKEPWWYYLAVLPALWLPWSLVLPALPWHRIFSASVWANLKSARNGERQGLGFVWIFFLSAFALISLIQHKQPVYLVPLMGPLAVLTGRAVLQMSPLRGTVLQRVMALFFFFLAVIFVLLPVYYSGNISAPFSWLDKLAFPQWEVKLNGIFLLAVIMLATTCLLIGLVKARRSESTLLIVLISVTLFSYPLSTMTMPSLDSVVSSKSASVELKRYVDLGYYPISFRIYSGVFSYYSGLVISETDDWAELDRMIASYPRVIVAMAASRWEEWTNNPDFIEVMRFWMLSNEYVLILRDNLRDKDPTTPPDVPEPAWPVIIEDELEAPAAPMPDDLPDEPDLPEEVLPDALEAAEISPDAGGLVEEHPLDEPSREIPLSDAEPLPLPDGLPLNDAPQPEDPFAPFPTE